jgi:hypothetical protein
MMSPASFEAAVGPKRAECSTGGIDGYVLRVAYFVCRTGSSMKSLESHPSRHRFKPRQYEAKSMSAADSYIMPGSNWPELPCLGSTPRYFFIVCTFSAAEAHSCHSDYGMLSATINQLHADFKINNPSSKIHEIGCVFSMCEAVTSACVAAGRAAGMHGATCDPNFIIALSRSLVHAGIARGCDFCCLTYFQQNSRCVC